MTRSMEKLSFRCDTNSPLSLFPAFVLDSHAMLSGGSIWKEHL